MQALLDGVVLDALMQNLNVGTSILFIGAVVTWRLGPKRSAIWRAMKLWCEDNELAAELRESRRELRRQPRATETVPDNGRPAAS